MCDRIKTPNDFHPPIEIYDVNYYYYKTVVGRKISLDKKKKKPKTINSQTTSAKGPVRRRRFRSPYV